LVDGLQRQEELQWRRSVEQLNKNEQNKTGRLGALFLWDKFDH